MDQTQLSNLKAEINALAISLSDYNTSVFNYLNGSNAACLHFLEVVDTLKNETSTAIAFNTAWFGQNSSYGALADFVFEVASIQRSKAILDMTKSTYYTNNDTQKVLEEGYNKGETTRTIAYIMGNSPDQGITI